MPIALGARLGPYEVTAKLGEGGMGEVYRARDTKLNRDVALKILPEAFTSDPERLARFRREAQVLASLNHANIAAIYGFEDSGQTHALVMELVEGEDLAAHIARGAIPPSDALPIAKQIADALEAAHEQHIVHRDLKPANIKVRKDGTVKVLDFGLAKALGPEGPSATADGANSPTLTARATAMGMILGTAAYMAPEQARGRVVDRRADIWAFGVVLFEMLTGRRTFAGDDVTDTIVSVVSKEPDWSALPASTPAGLRRLLARCLRKDPKRRLRDIGDARVQIEEWLGGAPDDVSATTSVAPIPQWALSRALPWVVAGALAVALAIVLWAPWRGAPGGDTAFRLTPLSFEPGGQTPAVWSPDGKAIAYGARQKETDPYQLYVRYLDSPVATQITTRPTSVQAVIQWTTSGKIVFVAAQQLWSMSPVGGEPERWAATEDSSKVPVGASIRAVSQDGSTMAMLSRSDDGVFSLWTRRKDTALTPYEPAPFAARDTYNTPVVRFSPDGRQILLLRNAGAGEEAWLMPYPASAANPPHRILQGISNFTGTPTASWMPDNRHVVVSGSTSAAARQLYLADVISGALRVISSGTTSQHAPAVSPDGRKLVFVEAAADRDIISVDLTTAAVTSVIATQRGEEMPAWASSDSAMVYFTDRSGDSEIWLQKPGQPDRPLVTPRDFPPGQTRGFMSPALSPDGTRVIYKWVEVGGRGSLFMSAVAGGPPVRLVTSTGTDFPGSWSPDGNWYVYRHTAEGVEALLKVKTTGGAAPEVLKADVKRSGAWVPVWSPTNDWILYPDAGVKLISPDGKASRDVAPTNALGCAFSADGRTIYCLRQTGLLSPVELISMSVAGGGEKTINSLPRDYLPSASLNPGLRLALTPDGKSITYGIVRITNNLWLMDGLKSVSAR